MINLSEAISTTSTKACITQIVFSGIDDGSAPTIRINYSFGNIETIYDEVTEQNVDVYIANEHRACTIDQSEVIALFETQFGTDALQTILTDSAFDLLTSAGKIGS